MLSGNDTFDIAGDAIAPVLAGGALPSPAGPHQANVLAGPLTIDGAPVRAPSLVAGVRLPTEFDTTLPQVASALPNPLRIATLNVFDDLNATGDVGSLSARRPGSGRSPVSA